MMRFVYSLATVSCLLFAVPNAVIALQDPTRPAGYGSTAVRASGPVWHVNSIRIASHHKTAVVNGRTVAVGNKVNGATVINIEPAKVRFRKDGKEFTVRLFNHRVKKITRVPVNQNK